jgi:hypothetical protein
MMRRVAQPVGLESPRGGAFDASTTRFLGKIQAMENAKEISHFRGLSTG